MTNCLTEEQLIELYYQEEKMPEARNHLAACEDCQKDFYELCTDLMAVEYPVPDRGYSAVSQAIKSIPDVHDSKPDDSILTPEEVSRWLKVEVHNIFNMLHLLPHFVVDGNIRFRKSAVREYIKSSEAGADEKAPVRLLHNINKSRNAA